MPGSGAVELLTVRETADLLKVSTVTVRRFIADGRLPAVKVGRAVRIDKEAAEQGVEPIEPRARSHDARRGYRAASRSLPTILSGRS